MIQHGEDFFIAPTAVITRPELCRVGNHVALDHGFYCTAGITLGDYIHVGPYTTVIGGTYGNLVMGDFSGLSTAVRIVCAGENMRGEGLIGPIVPKQYKDDISGGTINLEAFTLVGTNAIVMPGSRMAIGSVLGANSFLKGETEPWTVYVGSPARPIKTRRDDRMRAFARELGYDY